MPPKKAKPSEASGLDIEQLASSSECTGLTPSAVMDEEQAEAYAELYGIHHQKPNTEARRQ